MGLFRSVLKKAVLVTSVLVAKRLTKRVFRKVAEKIIRRPLSSGK